MITPEIQNWICKNIIGAHHLPQFKSIDGITKIPVKKKYIAKKWGCEIIIHNDSDYCGKILRFNKGAKLSLHSHIKKETFLVTKSKFKFNYIDTKTAEKLSKVIKVGDIVEIPRLLPHQVENIGDEEGEIIEFSTTHFDNDSKRIEKGDNQSKL